MATTTVTLKDGLTIGKETYSVVTLREATAGDVIEAHEESEKVVVVPTLTPKGKLVDKPQMVASPMMVGVNVMRRQIVAIDSHSGDSYSGPLMLDEVKTLSPRDLDAIQDAVDAMDLAALDAAEAASERGRDDGAGDGA